MNDSIGVELSVTVNSIDQVLVVPMDTASQDSVPNSIIPSVEVMFEAISKWSNVQSSLVLSLMLVIILYLAKYLFFKIPVGSDKSIAIILELCVDLLSIMLPLEVFTILSDGFQLPCVMFTMFTMLLILGVSYSRRTILELIIHEKRLSWCSCGWLFFVIAFVSIFSLYFGFYIWK